MRIEQRISDTMRAFHADPAIRLELLTRLEAHAQAGEIVNRANFWQDGKGGPVACLVHDTSLVVWQERTGIPRAVGNALDMVASNLDGPERAARFALEWLEAVAVGQDLRSVAPALIDWLLTDSEHGVLRFAEGEALRQTISRVAELHRRVAAGDAPPEAEWRAARTAAIAATDAGGNAGEKLIAAAAEAAAWNPATSATVVSDTVGVWAKLFSRRAPQSAGRGWALNQEIKAWLAQLTADAEKAGLPAPNISERDLCEKHPAAVALKRIQSDEIKRALREDRQRLAQALLTMTRRSAAAQVSA
jgi:hypothetical protein